jgi:hypothetical protein
VTPPEEEQEVQVLYNPLPKEDQEAEPEEDWLKRLELYGEGSKPHQ